jgi:hypothetical protein
MQNWDYRHLVFTYNDVSKRWYWTDNSREVNQEERLRVMGREGWELVSSLIYQVGEIPEFHLYFKRPIA